MKKRIASLLLAVLLTAAMLTGCGAKADSTVQGTDGEKISISMYLWDRSMFKEFTPWLEQQFPEIEFTFVQSYNTMDYYKDLIARGDPVPDIITCRRFSLNDAAPLADYLMDLSQIEVAGTFYSSYLEVNRETGGAIRWLPMCAEVDSIMANKDLFDQYNIPLPPTTRNLWRPSMPLRKWASRASRPTGIMIIPVLKPCRAAPSPS